MTQIIKHKCEICNKEFKTYKFAPKMPVNTYNFRTFEVKFRDEGLNLKMDGVTYWFCNGCWFEKIIPEKSRIEIQTDILSGKFKTFQNPIPPKKILKALLET